jgi:hypothetical protein
MRMGLLASGLFAGLMMTLAFVLRRQWDGMEARDFVPNFQGFLAVAKGNPAVTAITMAASLAPLAAGAISLARGALSRGALCALAGLAFLGGCLVFTLRVNFPIYERAMSWKGPEGAEDRLEILRRFNRSNIVRLASSLTAFALLLAAIAVG